MTTPNAKDQTALSDLLTSTIALLAQFSPTPTLTTQPPPQIPNAPNPLHVLRDAGTLLKAHTTKLSLLAITKPFTPSAIITVLKDLSGTCIPALKSAEQICSHQARETWGAIMSAEVQKRVARTFRELEALLSEIKSLNNGTAIKGRGEGLGSTGVVWEACDALIALDGLGIAGLAVEKAEMYRDTIKDAITELQEWRDGEDVDHEGHEDDLVDEFDEDVHGDDDSFDDLFNAANSMPKDNPELKALVDEADGKLKKIVLLYNALIKRRVKTFKSGDIPEKNVAALDDLIEKLKNVPNLVDELVGSFYDLDEDNAKETLKSCVDEAKTAAGKVDQNWEAKEDEFTNWHKKWEEAIA
ncbi:Hypothetical protein R9X50_00574000 [Acrodontium crateriforme]|uniref:Uncharacterized protein n=1 Tax=Acrodontium crateriforme TaxID=150365 RepID=A0AAQ3M8D2_9PEZI|nr:Hypothetical protein R9X50_00574000 [Acrodontium crateriforme]